MSKNTSRYGSKAAKRRKAKKKRIIKIWLAIFVFLMALLTCLAACAFWMLGKINHKTINKTTSALGINASNFEDKKYDDIVNIALFGIDARGGSSGRSDATMILSIDRKRNKVRVISLMRDSYVKVERHGYTKLCHAYAYGKAQLAIKTINQNYSMNIKDYVTVNFDSLAQVIDAVGGVTINISEAERKNANISIREYAQAYRKKPTYIQRSGEQLLNGMQAVGYARIRHVGRDDFERTARQRRVLEQMFNKALSMNPVEYPKMVTTILPLVETSLNAQDILGIGITVMKSGAAKFEQTRFPLDEDVKPKRIDGISYVWSNQNVTNQKLHSFIFDDINPSSK